jgi:transcriptional regulator with XRE-family HTH domain
LNSRQRREVCKRDSEQAQWRLLRKPKGRFAAHLKALLDQRGLTTQAFADAAGVGEPTVRKWLRAESVPETLDLQRIGDALDTTKHPFPDYRMILPPAE